MNDSSNLPEIKSIRRRGLRNFYRPSCLHRSGFAHRSDCLGGVELTHRQVGEIREFSVCL
jgi:hypothetical protein